jgi:hypothetical protein
MEEYRGRPGEQERQCAELGANCGELGRARIRPREKCHIMNKIDVRRPSKFPGLTARGPVEIRSFHVEQLDAL